jgi:hypothetical protein
MRRSLTLSSLTPFSSDLKAGSLRRKISYGKRNHRKDVAPSESVIRSILNYSLALSVFHTEDAGMVKMVMN